MDILEILSRLGFDYRVFLFNLVNISIALFLLRKFVVLPVLNIIKERQDLIRQGFEQEQQARELLEDANRRAREILSNAVSESGIIIENAKKQANEHADAILNRANDRAEGILLNAQREIEIKEKTMMERAKDKLGDMVVVATQKVFKS
jgi:F-type H+-transporting ATPase subunit b